MKADNRKITNQNVTTFIKLIHEVHEIALGKPITKVSEGTGEDMAIKIFECSGVSISGKTLCKYTEAVLENKCDVINPQLPILHGLAKYVLQSKYAVESKEIKNYPYWIDYENKYASTKREIILNTLADTFESKAEETPISPLQKEVIDDAESKKNIEHHQQVVPANTSDIILENKVAEHSFKPSDHATLLKAGIYGGACAGFFGVLLIAALRYFSNETIPFVTTGYENISKDFFFQRIFPIVFLFQTAGGALLGWLCCYNALRQSTLLRNSLFFLIVFVIMFFLRQTTVRNAWMPVGEHTYIDKNGSKLTLSGGPLGEPDFEALAASLMGAVSFVVLAGYVRIKITTFSFERNVSGALLSVVIPGVCAWCFMYLIFKILTHFAILNEGDFWVSKAVFYYKFPHPDRVLLVILLCGLYAYSIIAAIKLQIKKTISY